MWLPTEHAPGWRMRPVDACLAPLVAALRASGYETTGSCCGHGKHRAEVRLADGRTVAIEDKGTPDLGAVLESIPAGDYSGRCYDEDGWAVLRLWTIDGEAFELRAPIHDRKEETWHGSTRTR